MNLKVTMTKEIPRDIIENIFITALEGGSNDWYWLTDETVAKVRKYVSRTDEPALSAAIFKAVVDHFVIVPVHDRECIGWEGGEVQQLGELNPYTFQERLQALANSKDYSYALIEELRENGDALTSDVVFQFLVMGECVFS